LRSQIASLNQEIENTSALINKYHIASSTVAELRRQATELRTLAVAAANQGVNTEASQLALSRAGGYIVEAYNRTIGTAQYNGGGLLDGSDGSLAAIAELENIDFSDAETAESSLAVIDEAIAELDSVQIDLGATQKSELETHRSSLEITAQNHRAAESARRDADYAVEIADMMTEMIKLNAALAMLSHASIGADSVLKLLNDG
jgi:flagellin-like hook-associated protein FlgL